MTTTPSPEDFIAEATAVIGAFAPIRQTSDERWGHGDDRVSVVAERAEGELEEVAALRRYRATLAEAGLGWVDGPVELGGRGLPPAYATMLRDVEAGHALPDDGYIRFSVSIYLPRIRSAEIIACQLYSEPGAGSDLAALSTKAVRHNDGWLLTGQKVWSSGAHYSDIGFCIARTDPAAAKHAGLTTFIVDLAAPGVEIRPIRQLTGGSSFDEIFLSDVYVPDENRVGEVNGGWSVVVTSLLNERSAIGQEVGVDEHLVNRLIDLARHTPGDIDDRIRDQLADIAIRAWAIRLTTERMMSGGTPGPKLAMAKILTTDLLRTMSDTAADILGAAHIADTGDWGTYAWSELTLGLPGLRVGGGTDEILKNAVGERVLNLPKDAR
jgi:alkylation response protein AidB-like acyl-CoA dehydrogenase